MIRLHKKCFAVSMGMHLMLVAVLVRGTAFFLDRPKPKRPQPLNFVSSQVVENALNPTPPPVTPPTVTPPPVRPPAVRMCILPPVIKRGGRGLIRDLLSLAQYPAGPLKCLKLAVGSRPNMDLAVETKEWRNEINGR